MLDIADELSAWHGRGAAFAVATVVAISGSAPRQPGASLAVDEDGNAVGGVSGGCVEAAVYELCRESMESGRCVLQRFGYSDDDAFAVGLTCGGTIDVFVQPVPGAGGGEPRAGAVLRRWLSAAVDGEAAALARVVEGPGALLGRALLVRPGTIGPHGLADVTGSTGVNRSLVDGGLGDELLDRTAAAEVRALLDAGRTGLVRVGAGGSRCGEPVALLVECSLPPPRMLVFGAIDFAEALTRAGKYLGYRVTVCDARPVFATTARFPEADEVVTEWPHRYLDGTKVDGRTAVCVLTHDAKFDVPLLERALRLPLGYVGAMGSRRTHDERLALLRAAGLGSAELARLHSPIGLDLGARTSEETALSIVSEIVARRRGGSGLPLSRCGGPVHHDGCGTGGETAALDR